MAIDASKVQIVCPQCSTRLAVPSARLGRPVRCPRCQGVFQATAEDEPVVEIDEDEVEEEYENKPATKVKRKKTRGKRRSDLREIARYQKGVIICVAVNVLVMAGQFALPPDLRPLVAGMVYLANAIIGIVCVFLLALKVYGTGAGILLGILTFIPVLNLIALLVINGKATRVLRQNGIHVGFFGADLSEI
jgi:predicted Zn finger-like uncharacterized protein